MNEKELKRFNAKYIENEAGCWVWTAAKTKLGYASFFAGGKTCYAQRVAYEHFIGPVPENAGLFHRCENCACCNPYHAGTSAERIEGAGITEKTCSKCGAIKKLNEFGPHKKGMAGRQAACRRCEINRCREYDRTHPEIIRKARRRKSQRAKKRREQDEALALSYKLYSRKRLLKNGYGLTLEDYTSLLISQNGSCAICGKPETAYNKFGPLPLAVDHNHDTGQVRGLLCLSCNRKLGILEDKQFVTPAEAYLEKYSVQSTA